MSKSAERKKGFTLLELLVAMAILTTAMTVIVSSFTVTLRGWTRGGELLENLHHGDFVMEQLVSALRSTAFMHNTPEKYGFWLETRGGRFPQDSISWVTSGTAFMLPDSPLANGLHRLEVGIERNDQGDPAVAVRAFPHLADFDEMSSDTWFVSSVVQGMSIRVYDEEDERWLERWDDTNAIPSLVEVTLYMPPIEGEREPVRIARVVEIPVAPAVANAVRFRQEDEEDREAAEAEAARAAEAAGGGRAAPERDESEIVDTPSRLQQPMGPGGLR